MVILELYTDFECHTEQLQVVHDCYKVRIAAGSKLAIIVNQALLPVVRSRPCQDPDELLEPLSFWMFRHSSAICPYDSLAKVGRVGRTCGFFK